MDDQGVPTEPQSADAVEVGKLSGDEANVDVNRDINFQNGKSNTISRRRFIAFLGFTIVNATLPSDPMSALASLDQNIKYSSDRPLLSDYYSSSQQQFLYGDIRRGVPQHLNPLALGSLYTQRERYHASLRYLQSQFPTESFSDKDTVVLWLPFGWSWDSLSFLRKELTLNAKTASAIYGDPGTNYMLRTGGNVDNLPVFPYIGYTPGVKALGYYSDASTGNMPYGIMIDFLNNPNYQFTLSHEYGHAYVANCDGSTTFDMFVPVFDVHSIVDLLLFSRQQQLGFMYVNNEMRSIVDDPSLFLPSPNSLESLIYAIYPGFFAELRQWINSVSSETPNGMYQKDDILFACNKIFSIFGDIYTEWNATEGSQVARKNLILDVLKSRPGNIS